MRRTVAGIAVTLALVLPAMAQAATYTVDATADTPAGQPCPGLTGCSLRQAVLAANATAGVSDTVVLVPGTYTLTNGELAVTDALTVTASGADGTIVDAGDASRAFNATASLQLAGFTVRRGRVAHATEAFGGAVLTTRALTLDGMVFTANNAVGTAPGGMAQGGAVAGAGASAAITVTDSTFAGNGVSVPAGYGYGGAIGMREGAGLTITASRITGNTVVGRGIDGGGVSGGQMSPPITVTGSTVDGNTVSSTGSGSSSYGGGLHGRVTLTSSTVTGNQALGGVNGTANGGGVWTAGTATAFTGSTITGNRVAVTSGGDAGGGGFGGGEAVLTGSVLSGNEQPFANADCAWGRITSAGGNVINQADGVFQCQFDAAGPGDVLTADPGLGPLGDHGGPHPTRRPGPTSPALDRYTTGCPATDQRGVARAQGAACDAGAVEARAASFVAAPATLAFGQITSGTASAPKAVTVTNAGDLPGTPPALSLGGSDAAQFTLDDDCAAALAPDATCGAAVTFRPAGSGPRSASLLGPAVPVALTGTAFTPPPPPPPPPSPGPAPPAQGAPVGSAAPKAPCRSRRRFTIRLNLGGVQYRSVRVTVDGRTVSAKRSGAQWTALINLRGRPRATVRAQIQARTARGRKVTLTRTYRTCRPRGRS